MGFKKVLLTLVVGCLLSSIALAEPQTIGEISRKIRGETRVGSVYEANPDVQVFVEFGIASWYDCPTKPELIHDRNLKIRDFIYPIAHKTLPFGTLIKVINPSNGRKILCRVIDRGPYISGRIIDLDRHGAKALGVDGIQRIVTKIFCLGKDDYQRAVRRRRK